MQRRLAWREINEVSRDCKDASEGEKLAASNLCSLEVRFFDLCKFVSIRGKKTPHLGGERQKSSLELT